MKAKIVIGFESSLLKNQAYVNGDTKLGHTKACLKAMWDIKMLLTSVGRSFKEDKDRRIQVVITAFRPRTNIDAQSLEASISDAIESGIHVNDSNFDISVIGKLDPDRPRIEIELTQED